MSSQLCVGRIVVEAFVVVTRMGSVLDSRFLDQFPETENSEFFIDAYIA